MDVREDGRLPGWLMRGSRAYWACQLAGWAGTAAVNIAFSLAYDASSFVAYAAIFTWGAITGLALSHAWKAFLVHRGWFVTAAGVSWVGLAAGILLLGLAQVGCVALGFLVLQPKGAFKGIAWLPSALFFWTLVFTV